MRNTLATYFAVLTTVAQPANAGSCFERPALEVQVAEAKHIFVAQIQSASLSKDGKWIEGVHVVEEVLKGDAAKVPMLRAYFTDYNYTTSGAPIAGTESPLLVGWRYLAFANDDGPIAVNSCTRTRVLQNRHRYELTAIRDLVSAESRGPRAK